jgi:hypothetical protein
MGFFLYNYWTSHAARWESNVILVGEILLVLDSSAYLSGSFGRICNLCTKELDGLQR